MTDTTISWERIRAEAAAVADKAAEIRRITEWSEEGVEDHVERIQEQCQLKDDTEALNVLLEVCLMRRHLRISEQLSEELRLDITVTMWLRRWSADDFKAAMSEVFSRLEVIPATAPNGIATLLSVAAIYRRLKLPSMWPTRKDRGRCAELMYLMGCTEETAHAEMLRALERFNWGKGEESRALDSLREIELLYRRTPFDDMVPELYRRMLVETMWLRQWSLEEVLQYVGALHARLLLRNDAASIRAAHEIALLYGPKSHPGPGVEAARQICFDQALSPTLQEKTRALFAEFRFIGKYSIPQAMERLGRFGRVNNATLLETLDVLLQLEVERFRTESTKPDSTRI